MLGADRCLASVKAGFKSVEFTEAEVTETIV